MRPICVKTSQNDAVSNDRGCSILEKKSIKPDVVLAMLDKERTAVDSRWVLRQGSPWLLSLDWLLLTDEMLELWMKPKAARREAGRAEKPGRRRPDWPDLSRRLLGVVSGPQPFCCPTRGKRNMHKGNRILKCVDRIVQLGLICKILCYPVIFTSNTWSHDSTLSSSNSNILFHKNAQDSVTKSYFSPGRSWFPRGRTLESGVDWHRATADFWPICWSRVLAIVCLVTAPNPSWGLKVLGERCKTPPSWGTYWQWTNQGGQLLSCDSVTK